MIQKTTLSNGLRIITIPQDNTQAVTVLVLVGTGSKYERREISGISHFLEHMFFKGTKKRPSPTTIAETLDRIGGIYNAFTSEEYTGYFAKVPADYLDLALDWVSDIFLNSQLPVKEIDKEKGVIREEINMRFDNPMLYVNVLWSKLLYGDQPAGWDVIGSKETISQISRSKLLDYYKNQYSAKNTIVCVAGNIKSFAKTPAKISQKKSKVIEMIKKYFAQINHNRPREKPKVIEKQNKPEVLLSERRTDQTHLCLGVRAFNLFHPQRFSQELLAIILGGMMSSRLFIKIREKLAIAYYIRTDSESNPDTGYLVTQAGIDNNKVESAILAILKEYKKISQEKVPEKELKKAKENFKGRLALNLESSDALASFYSLQELLEKRVLKAEEIFQKIDKISANDILKVAKDIFKPEKLNLALIGPFKDKTKFQRLLKI